MNSVIVVLGLLQVLPQTPQTQPFVPGEALIRFAPGTEGHKAAERSARSDPPDLELLAGPVQALGELAGTPLRPARLSGGGWLVVRVPIDELTRRTTDRLAGCRRVARATGEPAVSGKAVTRVAFRDGTPEAGLLIRASRPDGKAPLDSLVGHIARRIDTPLKGAVSGKELLVEVDLDALTLRLVDRLKAMPGIGAAQPNYRVRGFGPRSP